MDDVVDTGFTGQSSGPIDSGPATDTGPVALPLGQAFARRRDLIPGGLLILGAGLAIGGSFAGLDRAVQRVGGGGTVLTDSAPWHYRVVAPGPGGVPRVVLYTAQYFGVALLGGGLLALLFGLLLVTGQARTRPGIRPAAAAAGALLVGATLATVMVVLNDQQFDLVPEQSFTTTTPQLGSWLIAAAGVVALLAVPALLVRASWLAAVGAARADDTDTPPYGLSVIALPPIEQEVPDDQA
jgi:hypothetical protein